MKARIDTQAKTIAIDEAVSMDELIKFVKFIAPEGWREWKVQTNVRFHMPPNPVIIRDYGQPLWVYPSYTPCASGGTSTIIGGATTTVQDSMSTVAFLDLAN